jgi:hypothetical protein
MQGDPLLRPGASPSAPIMKLDVETAAVALQYSQSYVSFADIDWLRLLSLLCVFLGLSC